MHFAEGQLLPVWTESLLSLLPQHFYTYFCEILLMGGLTHTLTISLALAKADFKLRMEGSYLGILWYLLNPLLLFTLLFFVFSHYFGRAIPYYPLYLLMGILFFHLFSHITTEATHVILHHSHLIKAIHFNRTALILALSFKSLLSHLFELLVLMIFFVIMHVDLSNFLYYPFLLLFFLFFILGCSFVIAVISTFIVDFVNVWSFFCTLLLFGTPIAYSENLTPHVHFLNLFNPLSYFISIAREIIIYHQTPAILTLFAVAFFSVSIFVVGLLLFTYSSAYFPERM